jgi:uncharacterized membrane protein
MPQHARPLPSPRTPGLTIRPSTTDLPPAAVAAPENPAPLAEAAPEAPSAPPVERRPAPADPAPADPVAEPAEPGVSWYRSEPWLAVLLAAFVPLLGASVAPVALRVPLVGVGGLIVAVGLAMLVRRDRAVRAGSPGSRGSRRRS